MSSTYYVLCLSHDPAITIRDCGGADDAAKAVAAGIEGHLDCDLLIERVSGGPVEYGCPPRDWPRPEVRCRHSSTAWVDTEWLRLLAAAHQSTDPAVHEAIGRGHFYCWTRDRLHRLRHSLGNAPEVEERP